ncbi:PIG-L deacetylase family protein [Lactonifactor longoviformis]|uniref:PIG-L deacetylase family protein n=1 Tax=Lactonifactor longoviformis TaxID=341220 RepID=UPI0036F2A411
MSYLVVVAHPDDEVLGAGATMYKLAKQGDEVNVCIMCGQVAARAFRPEDNELQNNMNACMKMLGVKRVIVGDFPNIKMNTSPHLELVQFIEEAIVETGATTIITHHPSDLNNDHVQTSIACQVAARLFQRRADVAPLKELLFMEVLSSTEWALNSSISAFRPNTYIEVGKESIDIKIKALGCYRGVMRPYPHPRSEEAIIGLAAYRGAISGCNYAESFESIIRREE